MTNIKFSKKLLAILLALFLVITLGVVVFLSLSEISTAQIEPLAPTYIGDSKIFLLIANSSYGYNGFTPCFTVHITVRNDYTPQNPVDNEAHMTGYAWFIMYAQLYDKNGNQIEARQYMPPNSHPNYNQQGLQSGETTSLTINMATTSHNVDHYSLVFGWLGSFPAP